MPERQKINLDFIRIQMTERIAISFPRQPTRPVRAALQFYAVTNGDNCCKDVHNNVWKCQQSNGCKLNP